MENGEDFCCSGCAEGGPCICTYEGPPHLATATPGAVIAVSGDSENVTATVGDSAPDDAGAGESPEHEEVPAAIAGDGGPTGPADTPPAPDQSPEDDEPPTNGRLAIIMAAISEMPLPVQQVVSARLSNNGTDEQVGEQFGLSAEEVRQLIEQGQAILDRTIGTGFRIRYIGTDEIVDHDVPEPEFPDFDADEDFDEVPDGSAGSGASPEIGQLIARSFEALSQTAASVDSEDAGTREVLSEALREVGNLLRLAAYRLSDEEKPRAPLREALADARGSEEPLTVILENEPDIAPFFMALQTCESVQWARLESQTPERTRFNVVTSSVMGFMRDLMELEGDLRPTRLQISGSEITVDLAAGRGRTGAAPEGHFEMAVDSFFGARHFIEQGAPHHHSYRVEATLVTEAPAEQGFVIGFAEVRQSVESVVMAYSETLLNTEDPFREIAPTTENLARVFFGQISEKVQEVTGSSVALARVRVWESPTNSATYSAGRAVTSSHASASQ